MTDPDLTALAAMAEAAARKYPWALPPEIKHLWSDKLKVLVIQETPEAANFTMSASPDTILALIRRVQAAEAVAEDARMMRDVISGMVNGTATAETMRSQLYLLVRAFDHNTRTEGDPT